MATSEEMGGQLLVMVRASPVDTSAALHLIAGGAGNKDLCLIWCAHLGHEVIAKALVNAGADIFYRNLDKTAAVWAHNAGHHALGSWLDEKMQPTTDHWFIESGVKAIHVTVSPRTGYQLTDIFNFETRERHLVTERIRDAPHISASMPEPFEKVSPQALQQAVEFFKAHASRKDLLRNIGALVQKRTGLGLDGIGT